MNYSKALESIINGDSILIAGSGFSHHAFTLKGKVKDTKQLAQRFYELAHEEYDEALPVDLKDASEAFFKALKKESGEEKAIEYFAQVLKEEFHVSKYEDSIYNAILKSSWRRIYTTNYDNLFEKCSENLKIKRNSFVLSDDERKINNNDIIHLNGYIDRLNNKDEFNLFKLKTSDYYINTFNEKRWESFFSCDLKTSESIFIIGYSMYDIDIARIMFESSDLKAITFAIVAPSCDNRLKRKLEPFVNDIFEIGIEGFSKELLIVSQSYQKSALPFKFRSFDLIKALPSDQHDDVSIEKTYDLLVKGNYSESCHWGSITSNSDKYIIKRDDEDVILEKISSHYDKIVVIGSICTGKTILVRNLCMRLFKEYNIYWLGDNLSSTKNEIHQLFNQGNKPIIVVIDSFYNKIELVRLIESKKRPTDVIILIERSEIFLNRTNKLDISYSVVRIDRLSQNDIKKLAAMFDYWGFGTKLLSSNNKNTVANIMKNDLHARFSNILIKALNSSYVKNHLEHQYLEIKCNEEIRYITSVIMILSYIGIKVDIYLLRSYAPTIKLPELEQNKAFKTFCNIKNTKIMPVSSIFAECVLEQFEESNWIKEVLIKIASITSNKYNIYIQDVYYQIFKEIIHSRTVQKILSINSNTKTPMEYYSSITGIYGNHRHGYFTPLFWLQFSITIIDIQRYDLAEETFAKAYSSAKELEKFNKHQIDNHYARYLLERAINGISNNPIKDFELAHSMIIRQIEDPEVDHQLYPFRRIALYRKLFDSCKHDESSVQVFKNASRFILSVIFKIRKSNKIYSNDNLITDCNSDMEFIFYECEKINSIK